jgi:hypothetical protein
MTKDEKDKIMKQLLADAGYDYEPKPRKDGDEIWTPCGQDVPRKPKPMSKETKDKLLKAKRSERLKSFLDKE